MATPEALAFDLYGTLVDPIRIWRQLERFLGESALRAAEVWRMKQLEYTFRLTAMDQYQDFEQVTRLSLDYALAAVRTYKPSPRVYQHAARRLGRPLAEVRLVSSNPFDVIGAAAAGMQVAWVDRSAGLFDTLAQRPSLVVATVSELAERL